MVCGSSWMTSGMQIRHRSENRSVDEVHSVNSFGMDLSGQSGSTTGSLQEY